MDISKFSSISATSSTTSKNNEVRETLAAHGDDGTGDRVVQHYFYPEFFPDRKRARIAVLLSEVGGFIAISEHNDHGLVAEELREVASAEFDNRTEALEQMMRAEGWQYDGWECSVAC